MKKFIALFFTFCVVCIGSSCTKDNTVTPAKAKTTFVADKNDIGVGD